MTVCSSYCAAVTLNKLEPQYRVLPKFLEALIFNCLPARHVGIAGPIGTVRSSTPEPSILILMTLDEPPNWENVRWNWRIPPFTRRSRLSNNECAVFRLRPNGLYRLKDIICAAPGGGIALLTVGSELNLSD